MKIAVDCKNPALYGGGISHWVAEVLPGWIRSCSSDEVVLLTPEGPGSKAVDLPCTRQVKLPWHGWLPAHARHGVYDNITFPRAVAAVRPDFIYSPYHDVRVPARTPSVITVYDLCYLDAGDCYPRPLRAYRLAMLKVNLGRAMHVLTDSHHAKSRLVDVLGLDTKNISVVPCSLPQEFLSAPPPAAVIEAYRQRLQEGLSNRKLLLYSGGIEFRKNISALMSALRLLWDAGEKITLLITGTLAPRWQHLFPELETHPDRIRFLGRLSLEDLRLAYEAVDGTVYPSRCEGFGRVCLEAMACGTPFACSDLDVLREVAGDYPHYFDPMQPRQIANAIVSICAAGRSHRRQDSRFSTEAVQSAFLDAMNPVVANARAQANSYR